MGLRMTTKIFHLLTISFLINSLLCHVDVSSITAFEPKIGVLGDV